MTVKALFALQLTWERSYKSQRGDKAIFSTSHLVSEIYWVLGVWCSNLPEVLKCKDIFEPLAGVPGEYGGVIQVTFDLNLARMENSSR